MKNYKNLIAFDANGDLTKRWYVSYYYLDPKTNKYVRFKEYGTLSKIHNVKDRRISLYALLQARTILLEKGYSPFDQYDKETMLDTVGLLLNSVNDCIDKVLKHKKLHLSETSIKPYTSNIENFRRYLEKRNLTNHKPDEINKRHIMDYLDFRTFNDKISGRTRNNLLIDIKTLFSTMIDLDLIKENPAIRIKKVKQITEKNEYFQPNDLERLNEWLEVNNEYLLYFTKFIFHAFLRPVEICRLQIKDIDLVNMVIELPASKTKAGVAQSVKIMNVLKPYIENMNLHLYPKDYYLFSAYKKPSLKPTTRDYFTDKFNKAKKALGFGKNHTMYGLKHTGICLLLQNGASELDVKKYSRHASEAFQSYIRYYNMQQPKDLSEFF